ncbi:MAG TPA: RagB/SusD family nutrient uptake outer membrane protein [Puia sp.]|nr:RagB/SusD family nutrient uptake outer membrane protein [Puia sp.]
MTKFIIRGLFFILPAAAFISCRKDFLQVVPIGQVVASTTSDYNLLMNSKNFYSYQSGAGWEQPMIMGDDVAAEAPYLIKYYPYQQRLFQWQDSIYQQSDPESFDLSTELPNLYTCNKIINEVLGSSGGTDSAKVELQAEAMAARAWLNLQFINFYAKPYLASTAAADPGFPIITTADVSVTTYTRASVQEVYDTIIHDFTTAIAHLPVKAVIQTRMSRPAAEGLLGRAYLYMGRYSDALTQFNAAFTDLAASGAVSLYNYNVTFGPGGAFLPINPISGPNSPGNNYNDLTESVLSITFTNTSSLMGEGELGNDGLVITPQVAALYGPTDWRLQFYSAKNSDGTPNAGGRLRKYGVSYSRCGLQLPDLYLMKAECEARLNNLTGAKADLETLRSNRMPAADAIVPVDTLASQAAMIQFVIDERIREYAQEGYRWWDMRRLSVDPLFNGQVFIHTLYNDDVSGSTTVYTLRQPNRLVLKIPPTIMIANPGWTNNP